MVQFIQLETRLIDAECLEESDFENEKEYIDYISECIKACGELTVPLIVYEKGFNPDTEEFEFETFVEENNLINLLTMISLYRENPQQYELSNCWLCESEEEAELLVKQYAFLMEK